MSYDLKRIVNEKYEKKKTNDIKNYIENLIENNKDILLDDKGSIQRKRELNKLLYIDYRTKNINVAKRNGYNNILVESKTGLTEEIIKEILLNKYNNIENTYIIINCWRVLTKSNLDDISLEILKNSDEEFKEIFENKLKWGKKLELKEKLSEEECREYMLFRDVIPDFFRKLKERGAKIIIISISNSLIIKKIFEYYNLDKNVDSYYTPDICNIINKKESDMIEHILMCIENSIELKNNI